MRIERLKGNRVRVTVTAADLMGLNINIEQLRPNSKELHAFLFNIMETIKEETDFNPYNGQVVVEAMPSSDGISIIVSKIHEGAVKTPIKAKGRIKSVTPHIKKSPPGIFFFEEMDDLCGALVRLEESVLLKSKLYKSDKGYFFILPNAARFSNACGVLAEFSQRQIRRTLQEKFICEHYTPIANAESLVTMAEGIKKLYKDT